MTIQLADDGTLDTVVTCTECKERMRYQNNADDDDDDSMGQAEFIDWAISDAKIAHVCPDSARLAAAGSGLLNTRYRLYVGQSTRADVQDIVLSYVDNCTIIPRVVGCWRGGAETCTIIEIIGPAEDGPKIRTLAASLRDELNQDCVLLTVEDVRGELI